MQTIILYDGTASGAQAAINVPELVRDNRNRNNTGHVQVVGNGVVDIEGSANGTDYIKIVTGVVSPTGFFIALFPYMRANITTASGTTKVYLVF